MQIKHEVLGDLIVRIVEQFFDNECAYDDIHRGIWSGRVIFTVEDRKTFFIYDRKNFIGKYFYP